MKNYKLIKTYPGSPKLGSIAYNDNTKFFQVYIIIDKNSCIPKYTRTLFGQDVENNSEYWEEVIEYPIGTKVLNSETNTIYTKKEDGWYRPSEKTSYTDEMIRNTKCISIIDEKVVEKEYEILSFINDEKLIWNKAKDGRFDAKWQMYRPTEEDSLKEPGINIHSIKRLIDGKIFTVGDKVKYNGNPPNPIREIKNFYIKDERLLFNWIDDKYQSGYCFNLLNKYDHLKQPLFTTEDGINIYKGDKFWFVNNIYNGHYNLCTATAGKNKVESTKVEGILDFSTKKAAEEYILMNKPCLSLNGVLSITEDHRTFGRHLPTHHTQKFKLSKLKELVKSKL